MEPQLPLWKMAATTLPRRVWCRYLRSSQPFVPRQRSALHGATTRPSCSCMSNSGHPNAKHGSAAAIARPGYGRAVEVLLLGAPWIDIALSVEVPPRQVAGIAVLHLGEASCARVAEAAFGLNTPTLRFQRVPRALQWLPAGSTVSGPAAPLTAVWGFAHLWRRNARLLVLQRSETTPVIQCDNTVLADRVRRPHGGSRRFLPLLRILKSRGSLRPIETTL
mmetsp:Transcript_33959/g.107934  ORF Transcript_33959/g.107934 Transcript_33959/m.107934 type:complete len:221 (+) Transcript_33959:130-792(+)